MNVLIMSDTHFSKGFSLNSNILQHISISDMIIHCGDFTSREFYDFLNTSKKLIAVKGNNDNQLSAILSSEAKADISGFGITVVHGHFLRLETLHHKYSNSDIIIFGHTHHPSVENFEDQLIINPGSLTANRYLDYNTFIMMTLNENQKPVVNIFKTV